MGNNGYWHDALAYSWDRVCGIMGGGFVDAIIAMLIFCVTLVIAHKLRGKDGAKEWAIDAAIGACGTLAVGAAIFLILLLFFAPSHMHNTDYGTIANLSSNVASLTQSKLDLSSNLSTANLTIETLSKQNEAAAAKLDTIAIVTGTTPAGGLNEKLDTFIEDFQQTKQSLGQLQDQLKAVTTPIGDRPIASIRATVAVVIPHDDDINTTFMDHRAVLRFIKDGSILMEAPAIAMTAHTIEKGKAEFRTSFAMRDDDELARKPISVLTAADAIVIIFSHDVIPVNSAVLSGHIALTVNDQIPLRFEIAEQKSLTQPETGIIVTNLSDGFKPLEQK